MTPHRRRLRVFGDPLQRRGAGQDRDRGAWRPERGRQGLDYVRSRTPFSPLGQPDDVATAVAFLATQASYISGINLLVDGGWMAY